MVSKNNYKIGVISGISSAVCWGLDTVLMGIVLGMAPFLPKEAVFLAPFVTAFFHDAFSAIWTFIFLGIKKQWGNLFRAMRTKSALFVVIAALMGGPVGMTGYLLAVKLIGPSYTAIISSLYPAVGAILAYFILKEKMNKKAWIGLISAIIGVSILGYSSGENGVSIAGFLCAFLCVIGWGSECVICAYGMKGDEVSSEFALQIRQMTSAIVYGLLIIPVVGGIGLSFEILRTSVLWWVAGTALAGTVSYLCYYNAIYRIGATRAMGLNITYVVWSIVFDKLFLGTDIGVSTIISSILVIVGVYFVAKEPVSENNDNAESAELI
ncbi:DMT family transporter [Clostridium sp. SM-530-WT-3G]|uniref:EamA family transporter n=1 Tax=Clostridium sp. SM-530-WT-3G TaxID=2725303 RepID=UPI00145F1174|nr:DMT family transporter [Clostridium sp. SM-530-WT-3G]